MLTKHRPPLLRYIVFAALLLTVPWWCGCEDDDDDNDDDDFIAGTWTLSRNTTTSTIGSTGTVTQVIDIGQNGSDVWFIWLTSDPPTQVPYTGDISGDTVVFQTSSETMNGSLFSENKRMTGTFSGDMNDDRWSGTWEATKH